MSNTSESLFSKSLILGSKLFALQLFIINVRNTEDAPDFLARSVTFHPSSVYSRTSISKL